MTAPTPLALPRGPRPFDTFELTVERLEPGGQGVATLHILLGPQQEPRQYKVSVRKALPGDHVRICVEEVRRRNLKARIEEILTPSPLRLSEPRCPHFGLREQSGKGCGGCTLQSTSYEHQLKLKLEMIEHLMRHANLSLEPLQAPLGMVEPWFYRNKMEYSFGDYNERGTLTLGLHPSGYKHDVLDITTCFMLSPEANTLVEAARQWARSHQVASFHFRRNEGFLRTLTIREGKRTGQRLINITTSAIAQTPFDGQEAEVRGVIESLAQALQACAQEHNIELTSVTWTQHDARRGQPTRQEDHLIYGRPTLQEKLHLPQDKQLLFEVHPRAFFQPNTLQAERIYTQVLQLAGLLDESSPISMSARVLDLYCGTGTIGLCMAPYVGHVTGVELNPEAVINAQQNAALNDLHNVSFIAGDVGVILANGELDLAQIDLVVVDPPRAGLFAQAVDQLKQINAPTLIYVSCNPESLVRDLGLLIKHGYKVETIQPIDMFPHTHHIEHVVKLTL